MSVTGSARGREKLSENRKQGGARERRATS